jgi:hypothetical protein
MMSMSSSFSSAAWNISCMGSPVIMQTRTLLVVLLLVFLLGAVGHAILPSGPGHHIASESACVFHHGMHLPAGMQPPAGVPQLRSATITDRGCALGLVSHIPHPPTF